LTTLWNLSVDEKLWIKISKTEILPVAIKYLEDEDIKVQEAAGGILANLALSRVNHSIMVEAGVIPKLVRLSLGLVNGSWLSLHAVLVYMLIYLRAVCNFYLD